MSLIQTLFSPSPEDWTRGQRDLVASAVLILLPTVFLRGIFLGEGLLGDPRFSDQLVAGYMFREFAANHLLNTGRYPLWNPFLFGGLPFVDAFHGDLFYPTSLLRLVLPLPLAMNLGFYLHLVLAGLFTYVFLRSLGSRFVPAVLGGVAYQFTGPLASLLLAGHDGKIFVGAYLPLVLWLVRRTLARPTWRASLCFGGVVGLILLTPHIQMTYYLALAAGAYLLVHAVGTWRGKGIQVATRGVVAILVGIAVGVGISLVQFLPALGYLSASARGAGGGGGYTYAVSWSLPPEELLGLLVPQFPGLVEAYWGRNFFKLHTEYLGLWPLFFLPFAFARSEERREVRFFAALGGIALLLALGGFTPLYQAAYALLPMLSLFRAPGMIFYLVAFSAVVLAAMGTDHLLGRRRSIRPLLFPGAILLAFSALLWGARGPFLDFLAGLSPEQGGRLEVNLRAIDLGAVRSLALALGFGGLAWWATRGPRPLVWGGAALGLLLLDIWPIDAQFRRYLDNPQAYFAPDGVVRLLRQEAGSEPYRVLPLGGTYIGDYLMLHRIESVVGHHGNELDRYDTLLGGKNRWSNLSNPTILQLVNARYLVTPAPLADPRFRPLVPAPTTTYRGERVFVYEYLEALPRAWVVPRGEAIPSDSLILTRLLSPGFDPRETVLLDRAPARQTSQEARGGEWAVEFLEYDPDRMRLRAEGPWPGYLVLTDNAYPFWRASIDGEPAELLQGNYTFRALAITPGTHEIRLWIDHRRFRLGLRISGLLVLALAMAGGMHWWSRRKQ